LEKATKVDKKRLAIVPARGGSKRIPRKNIREFCGKPMIYHILDTARESGLFDTIHVSTEDDEIYDLVSTHGFVPHFKRPNHLSDDHTPLMPVLKNVSENFLLRGNKFDEIWLLMANAPLVETVDLQQIAQILSYQPDAPVLAVSRYPAPVEWAFERNQSGRMIPINKGAFSIRSQDLVEKYYDSGTIVAYPSSMIVNSIGAGDVGNFTGYILPGHKAVDIDSEADWELAEILFLGRKANQNH
jgi:pseudaminic acid cytidylyltransferase